MPRLFIALPLNEEDARLEQIKSVHNYLSRYDNELKIVSMKNYHITLKFINECSNKVFKELKNNFESISEQRNEIPLKLSGIGVFPDLKKTSVIWAGLKTDEIVINQLKENIDKYLSNFGFKKEKTKYVPHLTLARVKKGKKINEMLKQYVVENKETFLLESTFKKVVLYSSELTQNGPNYSEIKSIKFNAE